ncbi:MAG: Fe-S cluster assembly protein SufD [Alphaproteobacteria bacterium]
MSALERAPRHRNLPPPDGYGRIFNEALATLPGADGPAEAIRRGEFEKFEKIGFPGSKVEDWKYSPLGPIARTAFRPAPEAAPIDDLDDYLIEGDDVERLVFVNGMIDRERSSRLLNVGGVTIGALGDALAAGIVEAEALLTGGDETRGFDALNGAFADCGAVIRIPAGQTSAPVVQLVFASAGRQAEAMVNPRLLIDIGDGAALDLVETHLFGEGSELLTNLVARCRLGRNAILRHDRLQIGDVAGRYIGRFYAALEEHANLTQTLAILGGGFVRNEVAARLDGKAIEAQFNGLYLTRTGQHVDNMLKVDHMAPASHSDQFFKGVLDGKAKAAFAGKIYVDRQAQQTNAFQTNNNLLLSPDAEISSKPELEIYADDVKCSHGATAGELDETELFYLRSRGLDPEIARTMLTFAFASEVLERFHRPELVEQAKRAILRWLPGADILGDLT